MTKFKLLETIGYFGKGEVSMEQMIDAVDRYSSALLQQNPCTKPVCPKCGGMGRCEPRTLSDPDGQECDCEQMA